MTLIFSVFSESLTRQLNSPYLLRIRTLEQSNETPGTRVKTGAECTGGDPGFFLGGGALVSCSTSTPINHIVFFFAEYQLY